VRWDGSQWLLEDLGRGGTLVDGRPVQSLGLLRETTIQLGPGGPKLRVVPAAPLPGQPAASQPPVQESGRRRLFAGRHVLGLSALAVILAIAGLAALLWRSNQELNERFARIRKALAQTPPGGNTQDGPIQIVMDMGDQLFPSYLIASATMKESPFDELHGRNIQRLGDRRGAIGVDVFSPAVGARIRVEVEENEMIRASVFEGFMPMEGIRYRVYPSINYRYEVLAGVRQTTPLSISVKVQIGDGPKTTVVRPVRVASINDCPFRMEDLSNPENRVNVDMLWMFAAYVNENHPISDEIRQEALKQGVVRNFVGYQQTDEQVFLQVFALWNALQRRGVKYSSITSTPSPAGPVTSQYVRFLDQSVNNSQANCVDGTVLFASLLRQIGIKPFLVIIPGHMLLGFALDRESTEVLYLETTCIGAALPGGGEKRDGGAGLAESGGTKSSKAFEGRSTRINQKSQALQGLLEPAMLQDVDLKTSFQSFRAAVLTGMRTAEEAFGPEGPEEGLSRSKSSRGKVDSLKGRRDSFARISIEEARQMGVLPIAYQR
jgi:hypothetical protein